MEPSSFITGTTGVVHSETSTGSNILFLTILSISNSILFLRAYGTGELLKTLEYCLVSNKFLVSHFSLALTQKMSSNLCNKSSKFVLDSRFIKNNSSHFKHVFAKQSLPNKYGLSPSIIYRVHFRFSHSIGITACP